MPSTIQWRGDAAAVAQVTTVTLSGTVAANETVTLTVNGKDVVATSTGTSLTTLASAIVTAWNASVIAEFAEATATSSAGVVTLTGDTAGKPFTVTGADSGAGLTVTVATPTAATGPNDAANPDNYTGGALPVTGDTLVFADSKVDVLYGLTALSAVTLAELRCDASYSGAIGLPDYDEDGAYYQYRSKFFRVGATLVTIGAGSGDGSKRIKLDLGATQSEVNVLATGSAPESTTHAVVLKGTHADNELNVISGTVDVAPEPGSVSTVSQLRVSFRETPLSDSTVRCGDGVTLGTVTMNGGSVSLSSDTDDIVAYNGELTLWRGAHAAIGVYGGVLYYNSTGTLTDLVVSNATADFGRDPRPKTVANPIVAHRGAVIKDPLGVLIAGGLEIIHRTGGVTYTPPDGLTLAAS